jgi:tetratricopeptide (TPR) repeat protein
VILELNTVLRLKNGHECTGYKEKNNTDQVQINEEGYTMRHLRSTLLKIFALLIIISISPVYAQAQSLTSSEDRSLGKVDFAISCIKDVQTRFNRALALLHNMMYQQAEKEFEAVAALDPDCAMAYWGISMTLLHPLWAPPSSDELKRGQEAIHKAAGLQPPTEREMGYISALKAFYKDWESVGHAARISAWERLQEKVFKENLEDIDAGAFYALSHLATAPKGDKNFTHQKESGAILENLLTRAPMHPGLFHYTIHAYDNPLLADRAFEVAREYNKIAPDAPHAQHMPSHIFVRLGLWTLSAEWNMRSAEAARKQSTPGELSLHYIHAMDYLIYAYLQKAQDKKALDTLNTINSVEKYQDSFASAYGIAAAQARYPLELRKWDKAAALKIRTHSTFPWDKYPWFESITYFARGLGAARSKNTDGARDAIKTLDAFYERTIKTGQDYWAVLVDSQRKTIAAWSVFSEGETDKALQMMKKAAEIEDSVDKHPVTPGAVLPARELLGDMLVLLGKYKEAIDAYKESLLISPNRFNSLYGAGHAAEKAGDTEKAKYYYTKLEELTEGVDSDRMSIKRAKAFLAKK